MGNVVSADRNSCLQLAWDRGIIVVVCLLFSYAVLRLLSLFFSTMIFGVLDFNLLVGVAVYFTCNYRNFYLEWLSVS